MRKFYFLTVLALPFFASGQDANITSWKINTTGHQAQYYNSSSMVVNLNDSSEVLQVCYNTDSIYIRTSMLASFIMGDWPGDPFLADGQNKSYILDRTPLYPSAMHATKLTGMLGLQVNGVPLYDDGDGKSYNTAMNANNNTGEGVWNQIAWVSHINEMDAGNGHPDPTSTYHNHHNPIQLCSVTDDSEHSPIVGWALDGWPIYGPFGYTDAMDSTSGITRMTSTWQLRSITTRTTLYDGTPTSQVGPPVSGTFPLGIFIEDYEYNAGTGDLDYYNGRYCITPEYPDGTYAYFLNTDATGNPSYPNMVGPQYYGLILPVNLGPGAGNADNLTTGVTCYEPAGAGLTDELPKAALANVYPNPSADLVNIDYNGNMEEVMITDSKGQLVYSASQPANQISISFLTPGMYHVLIIGDKGVENVVLVKQ
jgi:hypothetical protein